MYQQLATYLLEFKQVTIPQVGSFELVPQAATLDVASKLIRPPFYLPQYSDKDHVKEHQLNFLALDLNADKDAVKKELENFGQELRKRIRQDIFWWKGVGKLEAEESKMVFHPEVVTIAGLQPISAEKVLRKNVQHTVLRGEQEVLSGASSHEEKEVIKKRPVTELIGWVMVALSIVFCLFYLYRNGTNTTAAGTRIKIVPANSSPTHK